MFGTAQNLAAQRFNLMDVREAFGSRALKRVPPTSSGRLTVAVGIANFF